MSKIKNSTDTLLFSPFRFRMNKKPFQAVLSSRKSDRDFRSVTDNVTQYETPKGIQDPGSISPFKNSLKEALKIALSISKMAVKFSHEKYTCSGENSSRTLSV